MAPPSTIRTALPAPPVPHPPRRAFSLVLYAGATEERLIRHLALDRLRDLRDDGVTWDYIGRMYDSGGEEMRRVERRLRGRG